MSEKPLTERREKNQRAYRAYYERHPEQTLKDQQRQERYQSETRTVADRHNSRWDALDEEDAIDLSIPLSDYACGMGTTYAAICQGRHRRIQRYGLSNSLIKQEHDEYMALMRRKDFTRDDVTKHKQKWEAKKRDYFQGSDACPPRCTPFPTFLAGHWFAAISETLRDC